MGVAFPKRILIGWLTLSALALLPFLPVVRAERLPVKTYTIADGLARDGINRIVRDSRGFLWFCTREGLSRFDGYKFTNYGIDQGLSHRSVNDFLETRGGEYWIATTSGIYRFNPKGKPANAKADGASPAEPMFVAYFPDNERARWVLDLYEDSAGLIWCATEGGLYRLEQTGNQWSLRFLDIGITVRDKDDENIIVYTMVEDDRGALWIASHSGLFRRWPDGRVERLTHKGASRLLKDRNGRLWAGSQDLYRIVSDPHPERQIVDRVFTKKDGLLSETITSLLQTSDGKLWVGTTGGLSELIDEGQVGERFRTYTTANGLASDVISALAEDRDGNLWAGGRGVMKISRSGLVAYSSADGIRSPLLYSIFKDQAGKLCLFGGTVEYKLIEWFDGKRFHSVRPNVGSRLKYWGWGSHQNTFQDRAGEWWVATGEGLYRYPKVSVEQLPGTRPKAVYTTKNRLPSNDIFRLFEDSHGDLWIGSVNPMAISRWQRATDTIHNYPPGNGILSGAPTAFYEDREGNIWIAVYTFSGLYPNGLIRCSPGNTTSFALSEGLPPGCIFRIYGDHSGRLWLATAQSGLVRVEDPLSERPQFVTYTTAQGLSSNDVLDIVEDQWGRLYLATGRGVDRLEVETGRVRHYTVTDGLPSNEIYTAFRDHDGALWFGAFLSGLARLLPELDPPRQPPPIFINGLRIAGVTKRLSELGETEVVIAELGANQNQLQIDFFGLSLASGELLRYQYKLEGSGEEWSEPADLRTANYPGLTPGTYRFLVRAISADGTTSQTPAAVSFTILRPVWQRWWFVTLTAVFIALLVYAAYRYRLARLLELERVRTRIAIDLHDDIGASLSRMAILSEVVKQQTGNGNNQSGKMLTDIADSARGLVDSMSDIVWSIDPRKDDLANVAMRVRQFASDVLESQGISWQLEVPPEASRIKLAPEQRRHIYLICKEAINNIARHAACDSVTLKIALLHDRLQIAIRDNGRGFQVNSMAESHATNRGGNGLTNMQARAAEAGGALEIHSVPGSGTQLLANLPLKESHTRMTKKPGA